MRSWSNTLVSSLSVLVFGLAGCNCGSSHERDVDAAAGDAPFARDAATCSGPPPGPDCTCDTSGPTPTYVCGRECPAGIMPWSPGDPANACSPEGRTCFSGGSVCGSALSCECTGGFWNCAVAEPDPACWCGREPAEGSPCTEEGMSCGACCPSPGAPAFGPYFCTGGVWQIGDCPGIECPPIGPPVCPAERVLGTPCVSEGLSCGDPCCSAESCIGGVWMPGPEADCLCDPSRSFACGVGSCTGNVACTSQCGPDDGIEYLCVPLPSDCASCDCTPLTPGQTCEQRDGHVFVTDGGFCG